LNSQKIPEDEAGTSIGYSLSSEGILIGIFCKMDACWKLEKKAGSGRLAASVWKCLGELLKIDLRF
jgi:hypothetical protein